MRLDRTRIVIRERSLAEILDLALHVWRQMCGPLLWASAPVVLPLAVLNWWLLHKVVDVEPSGETIFRYGWLMAQLVTLEAPLATATAALYLGRATFDQRLKPAELFREAFRWAVPLLWILLVFRGVLFGWVVALGIDPYRNFSGAEVWLMLVTAASLVLRCYGPYVVEVIVLERNPLRPRPGAVTVRNRLRSLRLASSGEATTRVLVGIALAAGLVYSLWTSCWFIQGVFFEQWVPGPVLVHVALPTCMWLVAIYLMVVRFLSYLNVRIRREGWEVELQLRAAAAHLRRTGALHEMS